MKILFLDDETCRHEWAADHYAGHEVHHAYNLEQFKRALERTQFDMVSFDHDIADVISATEISGGFSLKWRAPEITGITCADWMIQHCPHPLPAQCIVHSWNPVGAKRLMITLERAGLVVRREPAGGTP